MHNRHPDVTQNAICMSAFEDTCQRFPTVPQRIQFQKMVFTRIPRDFQFRSQPIPSTAFFRNLYGFNDARRVPFKIETPLIQVARCEDCSHFFNYGLLDFFYYGLLDITPLRSVMVFGYSKVQKYVDS